MCEALFKKEDDGVPYKMWLTIIFIGILQNYKIADESW